jgi:2-dehydro-3-deoxyglucarate aldolase
VAQIEQIGAVENLEGILSVEGLDAILIGPYDLSASMGFTGRFDDPTFRKTMKRVLELCREHRIPSGIHIVQPDSKELQRYILEGYLFIAYSIDSVFLHQFSSIPEI